MTTQREAREAAFAYVRETYGIELTDADAATSETFIDFLNGYQVGAAAERERIVGLLDAFKAKHDEEYMNALADYVFSQLDLAASPDAELPKHA